VNVYVSQSFYLFLQSQLSFLEFHNADIVWIRTKHLFMQIFVNFAVSVGQFKNVRL
jgi:hypothetical protein